MERSIDMQSYNNPKPVILTFVGNYLPGYKAGGILRITINTVDHLCDVFDFKIVTRDRDLGDVMPYPDIQINQWQWVGNAMVYYMPPQATTIKNIENLIACTPHDVLYLNSFFDQLTIKVLWNRKFHKSNYKPVIVAPWGEFGWASLKQKYLKKILFIQLAKLFGLYNHIIWRASSEFEAKEIIDYMKIKSESIQIIGDLPIKNIPETFHEPTLQHLPYFNDLKIVFLSRISREKNLDYALRVLSNVKAKVVFDIYGPTENEAYWKECQKLIELLPSNVKVNYLGNANQNQVVQLFSNYDLFLFPTGGEAYGHVIAESLLSGTPVLISDKTPWRNLKRDGFGWDLSLAEIGDFVEVIENYSLSSNKVRLGKRTMIKNNIQNSLLNPVVLEANKQLFFKHI